MPIDIILNTRLDMHRYTLQLQFGPILECEVSQFLEIQGLIVYTFDLSTITILTIKVGYMSFIQKLAIVIIT